MSIYGGPDIETDGLTLHFDAGNIKSRSTLYTAPNTNILTPYNLWTIGTGGTTGFSRNGGESENARVLVNDDPWGGTSVVWETRPDSTSGPDGGWNTGYYAADRTKTYRSSVWVRKTSSSNGGTFYFGLHTQGNPIRNDNGNAQSNPYFTYIGISSLTQNQWYFVVGHILPTGSHTNVRHPDSGWYQNGSKISDKSYGNVGSKDVRFNTTSTSLYHRTYHFYSTNTSARLQFAAPRIDLCDGNEPSISDLLNINSPQNVTGLSAYSRRPKFKNNVAFSFEKKGALTFDGSNDYLDLETDITVSPTNQGWTCIYWFKTNSASTLQHFNSAEADDFNANWLAIYNSKLAVWNVSPGYWKYGSTTIQSNTWYQAAFVCDAGGTNYRYYINGEREGGDHVNNVWASAYSALKTRYIGRYEYAGSYSRYFNGNIAITKMHDRALSDTEIRKNFNALKGRFGL
jgi:hypothetical protein